MDRQGIVIEFAEKDGCLRRLILLGLLKADWAMVTGFGPPYIQKCKDEIYCLFLHYIFSSQYKGL